jgi:unsaturated rhamnogalacturonyl hydrolase
MLSTYFDHYARDYQYYKGGAWCYEDGCLYRGLITLYEATAEQRWLDHLLRLVKGQISASGGLRGYDIKEFNIDNILAGRALIYLYRLSGEVHWLDLARPLGQQLQHHPLTKSHVYWHKLRYPHQIWLDGLYMALPFKIEFAQAIGQSGIETDAVHQFLTALDLTFDSAAKLYRHGYDEARLQSWADPQTGLSPAHWARALGWLAMAFVDIIEQLPVGPQRSDLSERATEFARQLAVLQTSDGRWLQVIDRPDVAGNYPESSATAMFAYFFQKASRLGIAGISGDIGRWALQALESHELKPDADGRQRLQNICCVAGLGGFDGAYRDGSVAYYLSEEIRADDIKGVSPLMMAYAETCRADANIRPLVLS